MTRGGAEDGGGGGGVHGDGGRRGSGGRAGNEDDNPLVELAEMRRVIERQSKQMQEMQRLIMANATAGGSGNRGGGWGEYGVAQHANFGPSGGGGRGNRGDGWGEFGVAQLANFGPGGGGVRGGGNRGGGWGEYGVAQHANFGPGNGSSAEPFGSSSRVWPGRGSKRDHETSYEYAKLVAEASEDERSRRVRIETLRALQGGLSQLPWS